MKVIYFNNLVDYVIKVITHVQQHGDYLESFLVDGWGDGDNYYYLMCSHTHTIFTAGPWIKPTDIGIEIEKCIDKYSGNLGILGKDTVEKFRQIIKDPYLIKMAKLSVFW